MDYLKEFQSIVSAMFLKVKNRKPYTGFDASSNFDPVRDDGPGTYKALNVAFFIMVCGSANPDYSCAKEFLFRMKGASSFSEIAGFYLSGVEYIEKEIKDVCRNDNDFSERLVGLSNWISNRERSDGYETGVEKVWNVFFPEANNILSDKKGSIETLRKKREVLVTELNRSCITDPAKEILFTANALLTIPPFPHKVNKHFISDGIQENLMPIMGEKQLYWYDHPIQIGVDPEKNEVLYGLRALEKTASFEKERGNMAINSKIQCALSVSVTHHGLHKIAKQYLEEQLIKSGGLKNIDLYVFTEDRTRKLVTNIIQPAAKHYLNRDHIKSNDFMDMFGVDGEYGRHYSFLKAVAALWHILISPEIRATFKIDLDQVFPQEELVAQTGSSAFEHFQTSLWGAKGVDSREQSLDLGMIAGALVNERDISKSLFYPDVLFPEEKLSPDEYLFYSSLPQALSTQAEMMTRYSKEHGTEPFRCIKRFHVTGGTNGILVKSLIKHRPFTPSFIGRAEDQAYIFSVLMKENPVLAYVHKDGLIMRHDKEAFAQEAIKSASISKLIGDYIRILYFSAYARVITEDPAELKAEVDPFTGCFISKIPISVVYLRFCLKAASLFDKGKEKDAMEFIVNGTKRIWNGIRFISGEDSMLKRQYQKENCDWNIYYDTLLALGHALKHGDEFALELRFRAKQIIDECLVHFGYDNGI